MVKQSNHLYSSYTKSLLMAIFIILLVLAVPLKNAEASTTKQRIYDFAGLLTEEEVRTLENMSSKYSQKNKTDFIILTSRDADGKDIERYMSDFYDKMGFGYDKAHGNTVILTLDMLERDVYVSGFGKGEVYLDNDRCRLVIEKITPDLSKGNYYIAFSSYIKTSSKYMRYNPRANPASPIFNTWFQLIASLIVAGIGVATMAYRSGGLMTANGHTYSDPKNARILNRTDTYIRTTTTKTRKPSSSSSGSSGRSGGSGGGVSAGGRSYSGSRGKF